MKPFTPTARQRGLFFTLAPAYVWWKSPDEAIRYPYHLLARIMDTGTIEDIAQVMAIFDKSTLREVVANAEAGWFRPNSWHLWHYWLGLADFDAVPLLPKRVFH